MKAIHTKQPNQVTNKDERISTRENPATTEQPDISCASFNRSSFMWGENDFAPRRANKLKEFFGLFSIHNKLPQTRGGGTSHNTELSLKESSAKNLSKNFKSEVNSDLKFDQGNSGTEFNNHRGKNKSALKNYIRFNRNIRLVGSLSVIMLMFIATGILVPYYIKSAETEAAGESHFGDALLTFTSESLSASVTLSNLAANGSFATSTSAQQAKFSISTTNYTGYTLAIQAAEDTVLSGTKGGSLTAIPQSVTTAEYTANNISNVNLNNTWGFLPNYYKSGSNIVANTDTYLPISTTASTILDETTSANAEAKQYTISLGARADYTNTVDIFSNTFILQYIANPVNYAVTYDKNAGSDTVTNMPYENNTPKYVQAGHVEATSITLSNLVPVRENYTFLGWCSEATGAPVNNSDTCAGTIYNDQTEGATPNLTFNLSQTEANETTLYAMWYQELKTNISQLATMQDFASLNVQEYAAVVNSMTTGTSYQLADSRDNNTYNVAKLTDGNVWLQDNLALDPSAQELNSSNTNVTSTVTTTFENKTSGWNNTSPNDAWSKAYFNLASKDISVTYGGGNTKVGGYYNYCAASAGTYCYAEFASPDNTNATSDICPAGWKMPNGDQAKGSYYYLFNTGYSGDKDNFKNALHAGYSGYFYGSSVYGQGSSGFGYFWSATRLNSNNMYRLYVDASNVDPQSYFNQIYGLSVRCVLKGASTSITFNGNGADSGETTTLSLEAGSATLPSAETAGFANPRHAFLGWNTATNGSGITYAAGTTITAEMNDLTLYAQWQEALEMQSLTYAACPATPTYVYDNRDDKVYLVQRLKLTTSDDNGLCWMLDSLQLDIAANKDSITSATTNANDTTLGYLKNGGGSSPYTTNAAVNTSASRWSGATRLTKAMYNTEHADYDASYGNGTHKSGYYYNYCAASAGSYCYAEGAGTGNASQDICPAGWQMPAGDDSTYSYRKLYEAYGFNVANFKNALHVGLSGYFDGGIHWQGSSGSFWASTFVSASDMHFLYVGASSVSPQNRYGRYVGYSVRCVLKATN